MIFKVDFEKAFDSVRWDNLDDVLNSFGFGEKWRSWINVCLSSFMGSVLVNGNPISEFHFHKGLKQGDPLSPFLFILIIESLHVSFNRVLDAELYKGISINNSLMISQLFYADDAVFVGKWDPSNIKTIVHVLKCLYLASGLKINLHKSKLMGIGINKEEINLAASIVGCSNFSAPFKYLKSTFIKAIHGAKGDRKWFFQGYTLWIDNWSGEVALKMVFPRLYALELCKDISVADKLRHATLDFSFRRHPRGGAE
nr:RNA-directed DNA polymerase, eukaryota [Tanacetum cinerariifolium]